MKIGKIVMTAALAILTIPAVSQAIPWVNGGITHEYLLFNAPGTSWDNANTWVASNLPGFSLATITSQQEQDFLDANIFAGDGSEYWVGGYQDPLNTTDPIANWKWVTGEAWSFTNWATGEPNDAYGPGSEQYLGVNWGGWSWNDEGALGNIAGFVAERTSSVSVPEPGTMLLLGAGLLGLAAIRRRRK